MADVIYIDAFLLIDQRMDSLKKINPSRLTLTQLSVSPGIKVNAPIRKTDRTFFT